MADPNLLLLPDLHMIPGEDSSDVYGLASSTDLTMKTVCSDGVSMCLQVPVEADRNHRFSSVGFVGKEDTY